MWLDEATLPCLTWLYSSAYYQPDSILHECVARFEEKTMRNIVSNEGEDIDGGRRRRASTAPRPTWCNRVRPQCTEGYAVTSIIFSPSQLGIPSDRYRKYTFLNLVGSVALRIHGGHPSVQAQFQEISSAIAPWTPPSTWLQRQRCWRSIAVLQRMLAARPSFTIGFWPHLSAIARSAPARVSLALTARLSSFRQQSGFARIYCQCVCVKLSD